MTSHNNPEIIWDKRELLKPGDRCADGAFLILGILRRGGGYVCYRAVRGNTQGYLKELYPATFLCPGKSQFISLHRQPEGFLASPYSAMRDRFSRILLEYETCYRAIPSGILHSQIFFAEGSSLLIWTPQREDLISFRAHLRNIRVEEEPIPRILEAVRQVAEIARQLHAAGLLHLDISPETIRIDPEGHVILQDLDGIHPVGGSCFPMGGFSFWQAPEVMRFRAENRSDIYSIGALLFKALFVSSPVDAEQVENLVTTYPLIRNAKPKSHAFLRFQLEKILRKCLAPKPKDRYACCEELIGDLDALIAQFPPEKGENDALYTVSTTD